MKTDTPVHKHIIQHAGSKYATETDWYLISWITWTMMNEMWDRYASRKNIIDLWTIATIVLPLSICWATPQSLTSLTRNISNWYLILWYYHVITKHTVYLPGMKHMVWEPNKNGSSGTQTYQNVEMNENQRLWTNMTEPVQTMETRMAEIYPGINHWVLRPVKHPVINSEFISSTD